MSNSPDSNVEYFYAEVDLTVEPPIDLASGQFFQAKRIKDEDVKIIDGQMVVVAEEVTKVSGKFDQTNHQYGYGDLKKELKELAKASKSRGGQLNGSVVIHSTDNGKYFRLSVRDNTVAVEEALLGWPDGTKSPFFTN